MDRQTAIDVVFAFAQAWERCDIDRILEMLAPDAIYQNVPMAPLHGHAQIRAFITPSVSLATRMEWEFLNVEADESGKRVFTERIDRFFFETGTVVVPLMGIFELENGLIAHWRDYADLGAFARDMQAIGRPKPLGETA